jgi:ribonuclease HI
VPTTSNLVNTMKQPQSFIGLANYFRSYVKGFARVASDLNALTRQNTKWKEAEGLPKRSKGAFKAIKAAISSRPVMAYPNNNGRFHLYVDRALGDSKDEGGLGTALWQEDKQGIKQVIGYALRRLRASEKNYPAFLAEMQAAVYGMTYFQHYLVRRKFTLYTDHKPLCKLSSTHVKTLNRLQLKMTKLSPEIRYIEGINNTVTDFLSRYHGLGAEDKKTEVREYSSKHQGLGVAQVDASAPRIRALQLLDNSLEPMIRHINKERESYSYVPPSKSMTSHNICAISPVFC